MVSRRDLTRQLDELEGDDGPRETNWLEELKYAEHYNKHGADALTREEFFGEPVMVPDWVQNLPNSQGEDSEDDRRSSNRRVVSGSQGPRWGGGE